MRLEEIKQGYDAGKFNPPKLLDDDFAIIGTINQRYVFGSSYFQDMLTVCMVEDYDSETPVNKNVIAYLVAHDEPRVTINNSRYHQIERVYVHEDYRGQGLATDLYLFLNKKMNLKLISDDRFSYDGINKQLKQLIKSNRFNIAFYNMETKEYTTDQPEDMFSGDNEWRVLYEGNHHDIGDNGKMIGVGHRMISEYICLDRSLGYD